MPDQDGNPSPVNPTEIINSKGIDFLLATDIPRLWCSNVQPFVNGETSMLIFREFNIMVDPAKDGGVQSSVKNIASLMMPTQVLKDLHTILGKTLGVVNAE